MVFSAVFAIVVGAGMIGQWAASFAARQIPELHSEPVRIWFHIAGEMATATALLTAGIALLAGARWASELYLIAAGMLLYTVIVSPGYFAQKGRWIWVGIFGVLFALAVVSIWTLSGGASS